MNKISKKSAPAPLAKKIKSLFIGEEKEIRLLGIIIALGVVVIASLVFSSSKSSFSKNKISEENLETHTDCEFHSIVNGVCVDSAEKQTPALVAVMIENHPASRPQAGLAEASVVYEAMVEGNYTRFLAIFPYTADVAKVGPVRSARPYYLDWVAEYDNPLYMHVGGSPDALALITKRDLWDANEMYAGNSFWRAGNRLAPHNTYTNTEKWQKLIDQETENKFVGWDFATSTPEICAAACIDFIEIPYLRPDFVTGWKFNSSTMNYERWQGNGQHQTETGTIHADTIAIMELPYAVLDDIGRLEMKTIGRGPAIVVINGQKITGTWQKSGLTERTEFFDLTGKGINFKPGKIWIQVVPSLAMVHFTEL